MAAKGLGGGHPLPLHQVLHLAVQGDPSCQDFVLLPAGQPPRRSEVAADGALEVGQLAVGVHAVNYVRGVEPRQRAEHLRSRGDWVGVAGRGDLRVGGLQGSSRPPTFPLYGWRGNGHVAGCRSRLAGATEAAGWFTKGGRRKKKLKGEVRQLNLAPTARKYRCGGVKIQTRWNITPVLVSLVSSVHLASFHTVLQVM